MELDKYTIGVGILCVPIMWLSCKASYYKHKIMSEYIRNTSVMDCVLCGEDNSKECLVCNQEVEESVV
jgi:hypothetical protein